MNTGRCVQKYKCSKPIGNVRLFKREERFCSLIKTTPDKERKEAEC